MNTKKTSGLAMVRTAVAAVAGMTCLFAITLGTARAWEINFEGLPNPGNRLGHAIEHAIGQGIGNESATSGATTGASNLNAMLLGIRGLGPLRQRAVLFGIGASSSGRGIPFSNDESSSSPGQVLILHESPADCLSSQGSVVHGSPSRAASCDEFDDETGEVEYLDVDGDQIMDDAVYVPSTGGDDRWAVLNFGGVSGVTRVVDDLSGGFQSQTAGLYTTEDNSENPAEMEIPEPATAPLMVLGLGAVVWLRRRYRRG